MRKRLLVLPSWYPSPESAVSGIFVQRQVEVLAREYDVAVLVPRLVPPAAVRQGPGRPQTRIETNGPIPLYREEGLAPAVLSYRQSLSFYTALASRGLERIRRSWGYPDLIHAHVVAPAGWAACRLKEIYGLPVVLTEHTGPFSAHLQSREQQHAVRQVLSEVDRVVAVSPALAQQITTFHTALDIKILGNVIPESLFNLLDAPTGTEGQIKGFRFLTVALLTEAKGMQYLLEAAALLIARGVTTFEVIIGGDGSERPRLEKLAQTLHLAQHCRFAGFLQPQEVQEYMQQCDVFVLPSLAETFGMVICEAMACGKPVIATRCGGPEFIVTPETGLLVNIADAPALADAMNAIINGQASFDAGTIRKSARDRFGEEAFLRNISEIYGPLWQVPRSDPNWLRLKGGLLRQWMQEIIRAWMCLVEDPLVRIYQVAPTPVQNFWRQIKRLWAARGNH